MSYLTVRRPHRSGQIALGSVLNDFDRVFDSVFSSMPRWSDVRPAVDVRTTEDAYIVDADLPGFTEDQVDVRVENDLLVISAGATVTESDDPKRDEKEGYILRERGVRSYHRSFSLPKDADPTKIDARFQNGVLSLTLAKRAEAKPRRIEIKRG